MLRALLLVAALFMIAGGWQTDLIGLGLGLALFLWQRRMASREPLPAAATRTAE